jgi:hypothetical protein
MIVTIVGCQGIGTTSFSVKLALEYTKNNPDNSCVVVNGDYVTPTIPIINTDTSYAESLGSLLSEEYIDYKKILSHLTPYKNNGNIALLGYKYGENIYTYPEPTESKTDRIMDILKKNIDLVVIDTVFNFFRDKFAVWGFSNSDELIHLFSPDPKGLSYETSQERLLASYGYNKEREIKVFSNISFDDNKNLTAYEKYYGQIPYILPHSDELEKNFILGEMDKSLTSKEGKKYDKTVGGIYRQINERNIL